MAGGRERETDSRQRYSTSVRQEGETDRQTDRQEVHARLIDSIIMLDNTHHLSEGRDDLSKGSQRFVDVCTFLLSRKLIN